MNQRKSFRIFLLFLTAFVTFQGCKKEEFEHPEIKSGTLTAISAAKVRMTGEVVHQGKIKILDHGFVYNTYNSVTIDNGTLVSLGSSVSDGTFSKDFSINLSTNYNRRIYARAYLTNERGTTYGDIISIDMPTTAINGINPSSGKVGDRITITGSFPLLTKEDVKVTIGNVNAEIESVNATQIIFVVPPGINTYSSYSNQISVNVTIGGLQTNGSFYFNLRPTFSDFSPKNGTANSSIIITGSNFPYYSSWMSGVRIYFGSVYTTSFNIISSNSISVNIPSAVTSTSFQITIELDGVRTTLPGEFTVNPHTVTSVSSGSVWPGSLITIGGNNFGTGYYYDNSGTYRNATTVTIGGIAALLSNISSSQISAYIPNSLSEGEYTVIVTSGPHSVEAPQKVRVKSLAFTGFSPAEGASGREITLTGEFNPNLSYNVYFGNMSYNSAYNVTSTSMKVNVPGNMEASDVKLSIRSGNTINLISGNNFKVLAPSITAISPTSGVAGTVVTISGNGFSSSTFYNTVKFGTTNTPTILSATESTIRVLVPSNLTPGAMKISVTNGYGQTVVSPMNFTVTNQ